MNSFIRAASSSNKAIFLETSLELPSSSKASIFATDRINGCAFYVCRNILNDNLIVCHTNVITNKFGILAGAMFFHMYNSTKIDPELIISYVFYGYYCILLKYIKLLMNNSLYNKCKQWCNIIINIYDKSIFLLLF
jgi:hypothetical protein